MNAPFYIGQEVVAIRNHSQGFFKKGDEFVVLGIYPVCCGWGVDIGVSFFYELGQDVCPFCHKTFTVPPVCCFSHKSFAPKLELSETTVEEFIENMEVEEYETIER